MSLSSPEWENNNETTGREEDFDLEDRMSILRDDLDVAVNRLNETTETLRGMRRRQGRLEQRVRDTDARDRNARVFNNKISGSHLIVVYFAHSIIHLDCHVQACLL